MCSCLLPKLQVFHLGRGVGIPVINILYFHISTVTRSQTDLVLHQRMEGEQSTTKINATDVCFPTLDYPGLIVNLVLNSDKMPPLANGYPGTTEDRKY